MGLFRDIDGKISSKRVPGVIGLLSCIPTTFLSGVLSISDNLIIGMAIVYAALLGVGVVEGFRKNLKMKGGSN